MDVTALTNPIHWDFYSLDILAAETISQEETNYALRHARHWIFGAHAGWKWIQTASEEDIDEVTDRYTTNEIMVTMPNAPPARYDSYYPGYQPITDSYFEDVCRSVDEFDRVETVGSTYLMNAPFRAFEDGWMGSLREYFSLAAGHEKSQAVELGRHWLKGAEGGWNWVETAPGEHIKEVVTWVTLNETLWMGDEPEWYSGWFPGLAPESQSFFQQVTEASAEYTFEEMPYGDVIMNDPFRAYWDGWQSSVREFYLQIYQVKTRSTPDY